LRALVAMFQMLLNTDKVRLLTRDVMKKLSIVALAILSGCVAQPLKLREHALTTYEVPASKLIVDNLAIERKVEIDETIYVNGWAPLYGLVFNPSMSQSLSSRVKHSILANGDFGRVDISILRVGFFVEKNVADDIIFVDLLTLGKERGYKCDAEVNVKTDKDSQRITLTHGIRRSYFDNTEQTRQFVDDCQDELVKQIAEKVKTLAN